MLHRSPLSHHKGKDPQRKVTPPGPSYMSNEQIASYLKDLRTNRPTRPGGSRPSPNRTESTSNARDSLPPRATSAMSMYGCARTPSATPTPEIDRPRAASALSSHRPVSFHSSYGSSAGRPLVQEPRLVPVRKNVSPTQAFTRVSSTSPVPAYRESPQRRIEREEARSLREALRGMDINEEIRLYNDAQDEATELVWKHRNPGVPFKNPYAPYRNPDIAKPLKSSPEQHAEDGRDPRSSWRNSHRLSFRGHSATNEESPVRKSGIPRKNLKVNFALDDEQTNGNHGLGLSGANDPPKGIFRNPKDQIYEEPHEANRNDDDERSRFSRSDSWALRSKSRNSVPLGSRPLSNRFSSIPFVDKLSRFDLHRHPPSQSRDPEYKTNAPEPLSGTSPDSEPVRTKDGLEIRSEEIRAATSKKRSDRSSKLPMPTAVSDRTGRPIVSFDPKWEPIVAQSPPKRELPEIQVSTPAPPTIEVSEPPSIPVINLPDNKEPTIAEMCPTPQSQSENSKTSTKDRQKRGSGLGRFIPSQDHWVSTYSRAGVPTATCETCSLPIAGKVVTAAGSRFHPECFSCYHCRTPLECVAFYQEPEAKRNERLADPAADEEAHALRFYCHLDFHELFSPRCKSCKTPIEGEVVVACGAEWHVGHFFCAECGDPFDADTPFVEKDGYAWCLNCHSRRTAPSCAGCKKPVLDEIVITAVGGKWHESCFVCHECGDGFGPEGRYFVREGEPRRTAKGRIIGGPVQLAVCERCEGIRVKSSLRS
ncbi:hypothetical protein BJX61DRAFT_27163 [Aspergillus egyptiacus]|nr:hypothetical protein BJX61DRAFT_27163 [Aspergillus egyptiacus]